MTEPATSTTAAETQAEGGGPQDQCHRGFIEYGVASLKYLNGARIEFELYKDVAPKTVENFERLLACEEKTADGKVDLDKCLRGTEFHRVVPDYMVKGGDTQCSRLYEAQENDTGRKFEVFKCQPGTGGSSAFGEPFPAEPEALKLHHTVLGALAMANDGSEQKLQGSQFYISLTSTNNDELDGQAGIFGAMVGGHPALWMTQSFGGTDDGKVDGGAAGLARVKAEMGLDATPAMSTDDGPLAPEDGPWPEPYPGPDDAPEDVRLSMVTWPWDFKPQDARPADAHRFTSENLTITRTGLMYELDDKGQPKLDAAGKKILKSVPCKRLATLREDRATISAREAAKAAEEKAAAEKAAAEKAAADKAAADKAAASSSSDGAAQGTSSSSGTTQASGSGQQKQGDLVTGGGSGGGAGAAAEGADEGYVYVEDFEAELLEGPALEGPDGALGAELDW